MFLAMQLLHACIKKKKFVVPERATMSKKKFADFFFDFCQQSLIELSEFSEAGHLSRPLWQSGA